MAGSMAGERTVRTMCAAVELRKLCTRKDFVFTMQECNSFWRIALLLASCCGQNAWLLSVNVISINRFQSQTGNSSQNDGMGGSLPIGIYLESPATLQNGVIAQHNGVMDPFLKGHGDSRYLLIVYWGSPAAVGDILRIGVVFPCPPAEHQPSAVHLKA